MDIEYYKKIFQYDVLQFTVDEFGNYLDIYNWYNIVKDWKTSALPYRGSTITVSDLEKKLGIRPARSVDEFLKHVIDRVLPTLASKLSKS